MKSLLEKLLPTQSHLTKEQQRFWEMNGYLVLKSFFDSDRIESINSLIDRLWMERRRPENPLIIDILSGELTGKRAHFKDVSDSIRNDVYKLNDLFLVSDKLRSFILDERLCGVLRGLLNGNPMVCNSLNFERGSQQHAHFDTWYMPPPVENRMAVSFIALDNIGQENGPLFYYPGSHLLSPFRFSHGGLHVVPNEMSACLEYVERQLADHRLKRETFHCEPGDVFIWHGQLLHGGSVIADPSKTRRTVVTHYWRKKDLPFSASSIRSYGGYYMNRSHQPV